MRENSLMLALTDPDQKAAGIELMVKLALKADAPALHSIIADAKAKPTQRVGALRLMAAQHASDATFAETLTLTIGLLPADAGLHSLFAALTRGSAGADPTASLLLSLIHI